MADNFNMNPTQTQSLIAGGVNPNDTSKNIGDMIADNQLTQQEHAQLVQQAVERTKQAKIGTAEAQGLFDTKGYLAEKGLMPKAQAIGELKIILQKQEMDDAEITKIVSEAQTEWPEELDGAAIWRWFSALREPKPVAAMHGTAFQATKDMTGQKEADGTPVVVGQWYEKNTDGELVRTGEPSAKTTADAHAGQGDTKGWKDLQARVDAKVKIMRGNSVMNNLVRAKNGLTMIAAYNKNQNIQYLNLVEADVAGIMTGGAATEQSMQEAHFATAARSLGAKLGYFTGNYSLLAEGYHALSRQEPLEKVLNALSEVLTDLLAVGLDTMKKEIRAEAPGFESLIASDPQHWERMVDASLAIGSMPDAAAPLSTGGQPVHNPPAGGVHTLKSGATYTVS